MSLPEEEDSILQKSVIPNLLEENFNPAAPAVLAEMGDDVISRVDQNTSDLTRDDDQNTDMERFNEVTSYKRKQFKAGVDFRKTLGSFCKN